ncbi:MAG TPA: hypothetical protein VFL80_10215 [Thermoanaerobaculia bacterium]|nr:hypothetical protein [Thermoanaerobaculia bacterium]
MNELDELLNGVYSPTISDVSVLVREVRVRVGVLSRFVTIWIYYEGRTAEPYRFELSAIMKTARGRDPRASRRTAHTETDALRQAVRLLTQDYEEAVRLGEMPDESWLVPVGA